MMRRYWLRVAWVPMFLGALAVLPATANAQVVQVTRGDARNSIGLNLGYFMVKAEDGCAHDCFTGGNDDCDVLVANLSNPDPLAFQIDDFNAFTFGGEWLFAVTNFIETGVGASYYQNTVPSVYRNLVNVNGSEIAQDLKLKIVPISATVRFLPLGRSGAVEPYFGGGVAFMNWRYSESGEFVDSFDDSVFRATYEASGTAVGPVFVGGLRFPVGDAFTAGFEYRWQKGEGDTKPAESELLGNKIDLGGQSFNFTMHFRF